MWPGPYGEWGSRKYLLASLDQSLERMGLDYVDIFYSHRFDPDTPLEETIGALDTAVRSGPRALRRHLAPTRPSARAEAVEIARSLGTPILIHQPSYSLLNRWIEPEVVDTCDERGLGIIAFSPLGQGMLTDRYLGGIPADSRAAKDFYLKKDFINEENMARVRALNEIAPARGQTLAQMALAWVLRDPRVTSRADRRLERRAARDQRRRAREPRVLRRGAGRDRQARGRRRDQHLGGVQHGVNDLTYPGRRSRLDLPPRPTARTSPARSASSRPQSSSCAHARDRRACTARSRAGCSGTLGPSAAPVRVGARHRRARHLAAVERPGLRSDGAGCRWTAPRGARSRCGDASERRVVIARAQRLGDRLEAEAAALAIPMSVRRARRRAAHAERPRSSCTGSARPSTPGARPLRRPARAGPRCTSATTPAATSPTTARSWRR